MEQRKTSNFAFFKQIIQILMHFKEYNKFKLVWVGDSHAAYLRKGLKHRDLNHPTIESLVYWLGPRLMYSVSRSGFPTTFFFRTFIRIWKPKLVIISLGEIDVRMYLSDPRLRNSLWVKDYLVKVNEFRKMLNLKVIYVLPDMPISKIPPLEPIERRGSFEARLDGYIWLKLEVKRQIELDESFSNIKCLSYRDSLVNDSASLASDFTDDGIHVNAVGSWRAWKEFSFQLHSQD
jgi:hypothetical protein